MKAVVFGAGNIGRGFLGSLLYKSGFSITFVDADTAKIQALNNEHQYRVLITSNDGCKEEIVNDIQAIHIHEQDKISKAIVNADIILTAVGKNQLENVSEYLSNSLLERVHRRPKEEVHIVVVACENVYNNTDYLKNFLMKKIPEERRDSVRDSISFPNCVVDRIVPNMKNSSGNFLDVAVEEYFQFAIDGSSLKSTMPKIEGVQIVGNLEACLEQKLFTLNMAHAVIGYYGWLKQYKFVHEAVQDQNILSLLRGSLMEVKKVLTSRHRDISSEQQSAYSEKVISRFKNPHLYDEITRVSRDPKRKLGSNDRLVRPALFLWEQGEIPAYLSAGIASALSYDYEEDKEATEIANEIKIKGAGQVLSEISGIRINSDLGRLVESQIQLRNL